MPFRSAPILTTTGGVDRVSAFGGLAMAAMVSSYPRDLFEGNVPQLKLKATDLRNRGAPISLAA